MKIKIPALLGVASFCLTGAWVGAKVDHPVALRTQLVGATLDPNLPDFSKIDERQGYYLVRWTDVPGRPRITGLYLFPDPKKNGGYLPNEDAEQQLVTEKTNLPSIRKGWGVNIGDTPLRVEQKLGRAPDFSSYEPKRQSGTYLYKEPINLEIELEKRRVTWQYRAKYIFDKGRLRVIEYEAHDPLPEG